MDKRKLLVILAVAIAFAIAVWLLFLLFFYKKQTGPGHEEILKSLSAPESAKLSAPEEVINNLTAPE